MEQKEQPDGFGFWCLLELMGHVKMAGFVTEEERFGVKMGRIDVPATDGEEPFTQYFGGSAVYRMTPITESMALAFATRNRPRPVHVYELQASMTRRVVHDFENDVDYEFEDEDHGPPDY